MKFIVKCKGHKGQLVSIVSHSCLSIMIIVLASQFHVYLPRGQCLFCIVSVNSVLNVKALVGAFNQEEALVGAFSVIVKTYGSFAALLKILLLYKSRPPKSNNFVSLSLYSAAQLWRKSIYLCSPNLAPPQLA